MADPRAAVQAPVLILYVGAFRAEVSPDALSRRIRVGLQSNGSSNSTYQDIGPRDILKVDEGRQMLRVMLTAGQFPGRLPRVLTSVTVSVVNRMGGSIAGMRADGVNVVVSLSGASLVLTNPRALTNDPRNVDKTVAAIQGQHRRVFGDERRDVLRGVHVLPHGENGALFPTANWRREWGHLEFADLGNTVLAAVKFIGWMLQVDDQFVRSRMADLAQRRRANRYAVSAHLNKAGVDLERTVQLMLRACGKYASDENVGAVIQEIVDASVIQAFIQRAHAGQFIGNRNRSIDTAVLRVREMDGLVGPEYLPVPEIAADSSQGLEGKSISAGPG